MKLFLSIIILSSISVMAEEYKAPKLDEIKWQTGDKKIKKDSQWVSDFKKTPAKDEFHPASDEISPERKPSSGEEIKPKFWDFKSVK